MDQLELNIKALLADGIKVKNNPMKDVKLTKEQGKCFYQLKDFDEKKSIVSFYFSAFDNKDSDGDIVKKGSFAKTFVDFKERTKHLYNHDRTKAPGKVLELHEDNFGAYMVSQLAPSSLGKDVLVEYEYGIITEHSMGYAVLHESYDKLEDANIITEIKLWEGSSLSAWGANYNTPMIGLKNDNDFKKLMSAMELIIKDGKLSDDQLKEMEEKLSGYKIILKESEIIQPEENYLQFLKEIKI